MMEKDHRLDDYFVQYKDMVIRNIYLYVEYYTAEDLCQETFIRLQKYLERVKPEKVKAWLLAVSEHLALDYLKKGGKYTIVTGLKAEEEEPAYLCSDTEEIVLEREESRKRLKILARLKQEKWDWYDVLMLGYVGRMTDKEISIEKGIKKSLVGKWRERAQKWLREMYKKEYPEKDNE